jgi:ribosome biogenesis protein Nip4
MSYEIKLINSKDNVIFEYEVYQYNDNNEKKLLCKSLFCSDCFRAILKDSNITVYETQEQVPNPKHEFVQIKNPVSNAWCLCDKSIGSIIKFSKKKFKGIPVK